MSREIKFRVFDPNTGYMHLVGLDKISFYDFQGDTITEQDGLIIMQYTGLKDKNGVEIYEGDWLKKRNGTVYQVSWENEIVGYGVKVVKSAASNAGNASLHIGCKFPLSSYDRCSLEVIGNIHEGAKDDDKN